MNKHQLKRIPTRVCLGMPLYNQTRYLSEALNSIVNQSYKNFQLVIVDDSTIPEPAQIVEKMVSCDNRIHFIKTDYRKGMVDNWKACFQHAGSVDYFAWVSDHDLWHADWLKTMVKALDDNPSAVLVYPKTVLIAQDGKTIKNSAQTLFSK